MPRKYERAARKRWIETLNSRYGEVAPSGVSYADCAKLVSFFTNQRFDVDFVDDAKKKAASANFLYQSSCKIGSRSMRFVE